MSRITLNDFFSAYQGLPWQQEAVQLLQQAMPESLLQDSSHWVEKFREGPPTPEPVEGRVTPELMEALTGHPAESFNAAFCNDFNAMLQETGFDQHTDAFRMLMANLMHESCNFVYMKEIDPGHYLEGRTDLGNTQPGDGPKFRGCGPLQVTGRVHHTAFSDWLKSKGINEPNILNIGTDWTADHYPFQIAISWITNNGLLNVCLNQGFEACCVRINGGYNGYDDRVAKYEICKRVIQ